MTRQIFQIIPGGKTFALKNGGSRTCAVSYQGAVVTMGGCCSHGKVDRWEVNNNVLFPISLSDTTLKATTSTLYPTFLRQDVNTPAPRSHLQVKKRFDSKICIISLYFPGLVGRRRLRRCQWWASLKHGVVLAVKEAVDQRRRSSQAFHQNLINNHYHFDDVQIIIAQTLGDFYDIIAYCISFTVSWIVWGIFFAFVSCIIYLPFISWTLFCQTRVLS